MDNLNKKRKNLIAQAMDLVKNADSENRALNDEESKQHEKLMTEIHDLKSTIEKNHELDQLSKDDSEPVYNGRGEKVGERAESKATFDNALEKWVRFGATSLNDKEREALNLIETDQGVGVRLNGFMETREKFDNKLQTRASNSVMTNPAYYQDTELGKQLVIAQKFYGGWIDSAATVLKTQTGNTFYIPTMDDTGNTGALEAEGTDVVASSADLDAAKDQLDSYWISSTGIKLGWSTIRDSDVPLSEILYKPLATRYWRVINTYATTGTGSSQPEGVETGSVNGELASKDTTPDADDMNALLKSVDYAYHLGQKSGWMFNSNTMFRIAATVKSATYNTEPLWQPSLAAGIPDTLYGYKYWLNNDMDSVGSNKYPMLFGDFSYFWVRFVGDPVMVRLNERYAELGQTAFFMSGYMDSVVADANASTYAPIKNIRNLGT